MTQCRENTFWYFHTARSCQSFFIRADESLFSSNEESSERNIPRKCISNKEKIDTKESLGNNVISIIVFFHTGVPPVKRTPFRLSRSLRLRESIPSSSRGRETACSRIGAAYQTQDELPFRWLSVVEGAVR